MPWMTFACSLCMHPGPLKTKWLRAQHTLVAVLLTPVLKWYSCYIRAVMHVTMAAIISCKSKWLNILLRLVFTGQSHPGLGCEVCPEKYRGIININRNGGKLYLYPCKEDIHWNHIVVTGLPECKEIKVWIGIWIGKQRFHQPWHFKSSVNIEGNSKKWQLDKRRMDFYEVTMLLIVLFFYSAII